MLIWVPRRFWLSGNVGGSILPPDGSRLLCYTWPGMMLDPSVMPDEQFDDLPLGLNQVAGWTALKWEIAPDEQICFALPGVVPGELMEQIVCATLCSEMSLPIAQTQQAAYREVAK